MQFAGLVDQLGVRPESTEHTTLWGRVDTVKKNASRFRSGGERERGGEECSCLVRFNVSWGCVLGLPGVVALQAAANGGQLGTQAHRAPSVCNSHVKYK